MPKTDLKKAAISGERLRKTVEEKDLLVNDMLFKITISIGVVTYMPGKIACKKLKVINTADAALYNAKKKGRNKITIAKVEI